MYNVKIPSKYVTTTDYKKGSFKNWLSKTFRILAKFGSLPSTHTLLKTSHASARITAYVLLQKFVCLFVWVGPRSYQ